MNNHLHPIFQDILNDHCLTGYTKSRGEWISNEKLELSYGKYAQKQKEMGLPIMKMEDFINTQGPF